MTFFLALLVCWLVYIPYRDYLCIIYCHTR